MLIRLDCKKDMSCGGHVKPASSHPRFSQTLFFESLLVTQFESDRACANAPAIYLWTAARVFIYIFSEPLTN
jgi:hypothetical protein